MEDGERGTILKSPNSVGDYLVLLETGEKIRKNIVNADVKGFLG